MFEPDKQLQIAFFQGEETTLDFVEETATNAPSIWQESGFVRRLNLDLDNSNDIKKIRKRAFSSDESGLVFVQCDIINSIQTHQPCTFQPERMFSKGILWTIVARDKDNMSDFVERYRLGQPTQQGTIGQAFTAIDLHHNRPVIIKHLNCSNKEAAAAALQEWARLLPVRHPVLIQVFETDLNELNFYMALEYVEGRSLRRLISSLLEITGIEEGMNRILWSARAVLEGLRTLHTAGVAHGDLCPENIWLGERVTLLDSGLARLARLANTPDDPRVRSALNAIPIGTPAYRAPELALGKMPTPASDMYSLGLVIYESLTRHLPGPKGSELPEALTENVLLTQLLTSLLAFQPNQRPNVSATLNVIEKLLHNPSNLARSMSRTRTEQNLDRLAVEEAEVYQARAALLLETHPAQRARLRRAVAAYFAQRMNHNEALEECQAGYNDASNITNALERARSIVNLTSVEMQVYLNMAHFEKAISRGDQALQLLERAGLDEEKSREAAKIYLKLARAYYRLGKQSELLRALERARTIAQATGYKAGLAEADAVEAMNQGWTKGLLEEGITLAERCLQTAQELKIEWLQSEAHRILGGCYQHKNDLANASKHYSKALEVAERVQLPDLKASALYNLGLICEIDGDFAGCENYFLRSLEMAQKAGLTRAQAVAYKGLDLLYEQLGRLPEAYEHARLSLRLMQEISEQQLFPDANYQMGLICLEMGRLEESDYFISTGRNLAVNIGNDMILVELERLAADLRLQQGRLEEAEQLLAQSRQHADNHLSVALLSIEQVELELALARLKTYETRNLIEENEVKEGYRELAQRSTQILESVRATKPSLEARFLALHGRILTLAGNWIEAEAAFKQAIQLSDELKQRFSLARTLHFYGQSLLERVQNGSTGRLGQRGRAIGLLANAKDVYSECAVERGVESVNQLLLQAQGRLAH